MARFLDANEYVPNTGHKPPIIIEPDGSTWMQIFHHNHPANAVFDISDPFTTSAYINEDLWFNMSACNSFTKWELMIKQQENFTAQEQKFRWVQSYNPMTATYAQTTPANVTFVTTSGYTTPKSTYGGMYRSGTYTYLNCNNSADGNWWGATGSWTDYSGGIPAYNEVKVTDGYMDVYIRTDNGGITGANYKALMDTDRKLGDYNSATWAKWDFSAFTLTSSSTLVSKTLEVTTHGRPVFLMCTCDLNGASYGWARIKFLRGSTELKREIAVSPGSSMNIGMCLHYLDPVPAGTYSYTVRFERGDGSPQFGESGDYDAPVFEIIEIK